MELLRRVMLLAGMAAGVWLSMQASSTPLVSVAAVDLAMEQKYYGGSYVDEEEQRIRSLSSEGFLRFLMQDAVAPGGRTCKDFLSSAVLASVQGGGDMADRLSPNGVAGHPGIFFASGELPEGCLSGLGKESGSLLIAMDDPPLARASFFPVEVESFQLGTGYASYPDPPSSLLYPHRMMALLVLLAGVAGYLFLPRSPRKEGDAGYAPWRVGMGDFLGLLLFTCFFGLPLLIVGSSQAAVLAWFPLTAVLWLLAAFGVAILWLCALHASCRVRLEGGTLLVRGLFGQRSIPLAAISRMSIKERRPPTWLRWGLWLAAVATSSPAAAGMAALQSASSPLMLHLGVNGAAPVNIWLTDQSGSPALYGMEGILRALGQAGVEGADGVLAGQVSSA